MIINSIHAENVLKYSVLEIDNIPARGLISVTGDNESGKSSIGESICFALFGRTFSLGPEQFDRVIRWGETRCSIRLVFSTPDGSRYQIARFLDKQGNHGASLGLDGADPMVRGLDEVEAKLRAIIGFGYVEFIESFYLAQREISTPNPHSFAVKAMAGVNAMEKAITSCQGERDGYREQLAETAQEKAAVDTEVDALDLDPDHLPALEAAHQAVVEGIDRANKRIRNLSEGSLSAKQTGDQLVRGAKRWVAVKPGLSYIDYSRQADELDAVLAEVGPGWQQDPTTGASVIALTEFAESARQPLQAFEKLRGLGDGHGSSLQQQLGDIGDEGHSRAEAPGDSEDAVLTLVGQYRQLLNTEVQLKSRRRRWRLSAAVAVASAVLLFAAWGLVEHPGILPVTLPISDLLYAILSRWLPLIGAAGGVFGIGAMIHARRLTQRLRGHQEQQVQNLARQAAAREQISQLGQVEQLPLDQAMALFQQVNDPAINGLAEQFVHQVGRPLVEVGQHQQRQIQLRDRVVDVTNALLRWREQAASETESLDRAIATDNERRDKLKGEIEVEQARVREYDKLQAVIANLNARTGDLGHRIAVRELGIDLLEGAIHYISQRFNTEVRNLSADSLIKFTNGRYEHLQIDEGLNVKAFSNEKRDFMQLDEISSGTQRQIMLAVRMSLSQKLVNSVIQGPQMIFLDEPFAFFDEERTAASLAVLPEVSPDFTQIWVTSQQFPKQSHFDIHIECNARESISPWIRTATDAAS